MMHQHMLVLHAAAITRLPHCPLQQRSLRGTPQHSAMPPHRRLTRLWHVLGHPWLLPVGDEHVDGQGIRCVAGHLHSCIHGSQHWKLSVFG